MQYKNNTQDCKNIIKNVSSGHELQIIPIWSIIARKTNMPRTVDFTNFSVESITNIM